jgi:hypothetical protein
MAHKERHFWHINDTGVERLPGRDDIGRPSLSDCVLAAVAHFDANHEFSSIEQWQCSRSTSVLPSGTPWVDIGQSRW